MQKLFKVPLFFLFIASCMGLFLRYQLVAPSEKIVYSYFLHAHSHVMFLGWIFNVLIIAFTIEFIEIKKFKKLFWFLQLCVVGMLLSFPFQGYGAVSITFSTLHTLGALAFIILFLKSPTKAASISLTLAKAALLFFGLSAIGPFALAYLKANGLEHSNMYRFSIYFYLHFQYNGFFFFGILSLFTKLIEGKTPLQMQGVRIGSYILIAACIPAYLLSVLWSHPPFLLNIIGLIAAIAQLVGLYFFIKPMLRFTSITGITKQEKVLFTVSFGALVLKSILQLISAYPQAAVFANEFRSIVIAYLHLVLIGFVSLFLIAWLMTKRILESSASWAVVLILSGFVGSEILLITTPWHSALPGLFTAFHNQLILIFLSTIIVGLGILLRKRVTTRV